MEALSVLLGETLRLTWRDSPPCLMRLSALHDSKYGGELSEVRRRVGKGRSEDCSGMVGEFGWSDEKVPAPPWRFRSTDLGDSVYRLWVPRSTDLGFSVDRPCQLGGPTAALRSTDMANSVYRLCLPPGEPSIPAKGRVNTSVDSDQYHGRVTSFATVLLIRRYALVGRPQCLSVLPREMGERLPIH